MTRWTRKRKRNICRGRGGNSSNIKNLKKGLFAALGGNIFTSNEKGLVDQLAITLRQIVKHIGKMYGQEIRNKIHNRRAVIIVKPVYDQDLIDKQVINEGQREINFNRIQDDRGRKEVIIKVDLTSYPDVAITLSELQNKMADKLAKHNEPIDIFLLGDKKYEQKGNWKIYW